MNQISLFPVFISCVCVRVCVCGVCVHARWECALAKTSHMWQYPSTVLLLPQSRWTLQAKNCDIQGQQDGVHLFISLGTTSPLLFPHKFLYTRQSIKHSANMPTDRPFDIALLSARVPVAEENLWPACSTDLLYPSGCGYNRPDDYPADFCISRLRFAFSRLRFAWVSPGVVCGADPGNGLY